MTAWPVGKLNVEGNKIYSDEKILAVAGLKVGQMAGKTEFDAARDRLLATGAFESVGYKFEPIPGTRTNSGTFQIVEIAQLFPYKFEELRTDEKALREYLKQKEPLFGDQIPATQPVLDRMTRHVREFLKSDAIVAKLEGAGNLSVVFRPSSLPVRRGDNVQGQYRDSDHRSFSRSCQERASAPSLRRTGSGRSWTRMYGRPTKRSAISRVQFPSFDITPAKNVKGVAVTVHVKEGDVFKLGEVELTGELADSKELLKVGGFETGETVNFQKIRGRRRKHPQSICAEKAT